MNTLTYNSQSQLIVTIDDMSLVKKISDAVKLIKGVTSVRISNPDNQILQSASYKAGMEDIKKGNVTSGDNISMLSMLLDAFSQMPECTLHITGKAPDEEKVKRYASQYTNIIYHGMVEYDEYLRILHATPFLFSTRDPRYPENQCNFPSKVIEALLHNRIIISTIHYPQLDGIRYFEVGSDMESFKEDIQRISSLEAPEIMFYANNSSEVKARFNGTIWNECMIKIENNHD